MTYETMDWEAEARRVVAAFGIRRECHFRTEVPDHSKVFVVSRKMFGDHRMLDNGLRLRVQLSRNSRTFVLGNHKYNVSVGKGYDCAGVELDWDGSVVSSQADAILSILLAKGLCGLDLLTPEVELALKVNISAHQRLEWTFEYEARYGY